MIDRIFYSGSLKKEKTELIWYKHDAADLKNKIYYKMNDAKMYTRFSLFVYVNKLLFIILTKIIDLVKIIYFWCNI